jgi:predicted CXXCH cytochrome family protein
MERGLSHPVDVYPSMVVPAHLPLETGRVTCLTCHLVTAPVHPGSAHGPVQLATSDAGCADCHDPRSGRRADLHALLSRAHLRGRDEESVWPGALDVESETCMGCHDGAVATLASARGGSRSRLDPVLLIGGDHPIGGVQGPRGAGDNLVRPERLDPSVRLFDGRVGCGSCHSVYAEHDDLLVMSNQRSRLCLTCHDF